jgi:hypothetical protein
MGQFLWIYTIITAVGAGLGFWAIVKIEADSRPLDEIARKITQRFPLRGSDPSRKETKDPPRAAA